MTRKLGVNIVVGKKTMFTMHLLTPHSFFAHNFFKHIPCAQILLCTNLSMQYFGLKLCFDITLPDGYSMK